jgi:hypothetical protein
MMTPNQVQFLSGIADNFPPPRPDRTKHVQKVPQWYGETVGFWNWQHARRLDCQRPGWTITHSMFEYSSKMQTSKSSRQAPTAK